MEVMPTYMEVLGRYQLMTTKNSDPAQIACCEGLTYRANLIRINCGVQLPDQVMSVQAFRDVVAYEKKMKSLDQYDVDEQPDYDGVIQVFFGHDRYDEVSDDDIFKALSFFGKNPDPAPATKLRECGHCDKEEAMFGDYKKCSRCHEMSYCSKKCQADDWPIHKQLCGKKNTTNIDSSDLLAITKILVKNHSLTVQGHTGCPVPEYQQLQAKIALVKKLKKMFADDFKHFNSPNAAPDAGSDPAFSADLADFFATQPGYDEVWGKLRVGLKEELERRKEIERRKSGGKCLNIEEEFIRRLCKQLAETLIIQFGACMPGGRAAMLDHATRDKLLEDLVALTKGFALENPQYNSHVGLRNMVNNDTFKSRMIDTITNAMGLELEG